jgi:hypothetical protein
MNTDAIVRVRSFVPWDDAKHQNAHDDVQGGTTAMEGESSVG